MKITRECWSPSPRKFYAEDGSVYYTHEKEQGPSDPGVTRFLDRLAAEREWNSDPQLHALLDRVDAQVAQSGLAEALDKQAAWGKMTDEEAAQALSFKLSQEARAWNKRLEEPVKSDYVYPEGEHFRSVSE